MERIIVKNLSKKFKIGFKKNQSVLMRFLLVFSGRENKKIIWVNKDISFSVEQGKIVGLVGPNGSGKSTLLRIIAGIYRPDRGKVITNGKIISLINLYSGFKNRLTMKENIYIYAALFGLSKKEIDDKLDSIINFSELSEYVDTKVYQFSTGMLQKLAFSVAIYCNPDILLLDEVFEIGDEEFKIKNTNKIKELVKRNVSVILVSHDIQLINKYCDEIIHIDNGKITKIEKLKH